MKNNNNNRGVSVAAGANVAMVRAADPARTYFKTVDELTLRLKEAGAVLDLLIENQEAAADKSGEAGAALPSLYLVNRLRCEALDLVASLPELDQLKQLAGGAV